MSLKPNGMGRSAYAVLRLGAVALAATLAGCAASGEGAEPDHGIDAPRTTSRVKSEQAFLDDGFAMEQAKTWASAIAHYETVVEGRTPASARLTAQCALRAAMCHIELEHEGKAAALLEAIVHDPFVSPDEDYPAIPGGAGAGLRLSAEARLIELGGDPAGHYAAVVKQRDDVLIEIALISLSRIGSTFAKTALEAAAADEQLDAQWRALAGTELKHWGARKR